MRLPKWFVSISVLATIGIAVGWLWVGDEIASGVAADSPESAEPTPTAVQVLLPAPAASPPQVPGLPTVEEGVQPGKYAPDLGSNPEQAVSLPAETAAPPIAATDQEGSAREGAPAVNPPLAPRGPQTPVDERRDQLLRQRDARLDAYRGPGRQMPPWFAPYNDAAERYRDARRSQYRGQRDLGRQRHASWMDAICPWTKPGRDWSAQHSYQRQMEQLDRRAYRDADRYRPPYGFPGPRGWR